MQHDYTAVGHVTIDVLEDGSRRAGGTVLYSALQAARLGRRTLIVTRGVAEEIEALLAPFAAEFDLEVRPAHQTTTLQTSGSGSERTQQVLAWAGPMTEELELDSAIVHLAPIARETPQRWHGRAELIGLTPQGMARVWTGPEATIRLARPSAEDEHVAATCHAVVVSEHERDCCGALIAAAGGGGAVVAITDGGDPSTILGPGGGAVTVEVPPIEEAIDDLGAGDVFAAAFFVALGEGRTSRGAAQFATAAAAVRIQGTGAAAIGDRQAITARLADTGERAG